MSDTNSLPLKKTIAVGTIIDAVHVADLEKDSVEGFWWVTASDEKGERAEFLTIEISKTYILPGVYEQEFGHFPPKDSPVFRLAKAS